MKENKTGYIYKWVNDKIGHEREGWTYVGKRDGDFDPSYETHSTCNGFREDLAAGCFSRGQEVVCEDIPIDELLHEEIRIMNKIRNQNIKLYNRNVPNPRPDPKVNDWVALKKDISSGSAPIENVSISEVISDYKPFQVRHANLKEEKIKSIEDALRVYNEDLGKSPHLRPLVLVRDVYMDSAQKHVILDGNHTFEALKRVYKGELYKKIPVIKLDFEHDFGKDKKELYLAAIVLNSLQDSFISDPNDIKDVLPLINFYLTDKMSTEAIGDIISKATNIGLPTIRRWVSQEKKRVDEKKKTLEISDGYNKIIWSTQGQGMTEERKFVEWVLREKIYVGLPVTVSGSGNSKGRGLATILSEMQTLKTDKGVFVIYDEDKDIIFDTLTSLETRLKGLEELFHYHSLDIEVKCLPRLKQIGSDKHVFSYEKSDYMIDFSFYIDDYQNSTKKIL